jgi:hypothetical protein
MRVSVGARQPWNSGEGYSYELLVVPGNLLEYGGRALMVSAVLAGVLALVALAVGRFGAVLAAAARAGGAVGPFGLWWFLLGLWPALPVGNRSSLYVYFAALGLHLIGGAALAAAGRALRQQHRRGAAVAAVATIAMVVVAWPLFAWDRNGRIAAQARLSMAAIADIRREVPAPQAGECVVLIDDRALRPDLHGAFSDDLFWLAAFVYEEEPSYRVRYVGDRRGDPCPRPRRLELAPLNGAVLQRPTS